MAMHAVELIRKKRDDGALSGDEIAWIVAAYTRGEIPDEQMAALLMAIVWRGMTPAETVALTLAMARSGAELGLREILSPIADKHSTGGVGDKATLAVVPLVAACGLPIAKMSGRGLGHTGGTVDKLEAIPGFRMDLGRDELVRLVRAHGLALAAQSRELAPADGKIYALRDVTGTVESIPLIAASIMSKKLALGPSHLLLDVKVGSGAFMKSEAEARCLAETMVRIGEDAGMRTVAVLSSMAQPLGRAIGNALEVAEAVAVLRGEGPADVLALCQHEAALLLRMAGIVADAKEAHARVDAALVSGAAVSKLEEVVTAQGGDAACVADPTLLPRAPYQEDVVSPRAGYLAGMDAERIGMAAVRLGAGRLRKGDAIDRTVGLVLRAKVGDHVDVGQPLVEVHARTAREAAAIHEMLLAAYQWSEETVTPPPLLLGMIGWG